jgi:molybdopterin-guanine dinucleotide biosynthesis protein A
MSAGKHNKHTKLKLREQEDYANNELVVLGTKCSIIADFVQKITKKLEKQAKIAYLDASHKEDLEPCSLDTFTYNTHGKMTAQFNGDTNPYRQRIQFSNYDLIFINGNHYAGAKQILILDNEKESSLYKRLDQLNRVQFVIKLKNDSKYFDFLTEKHPNIKNLVCYHINEVDAIAQHIDNLIKEKTAAIQGLVLAGGKSLRMGRDKVNLNYHGLPQLDYCVNLMENNLLKTFISVAKDQKNEKFNIIQDKFFELGAFGGICSAFQYDPNKAWLVIATDLPFVSNELIKLLLKKRNPKKMATAVKGHSKQFVEPLIAIYEPKIYPVLLSFLAQGYSCPRKVLINSDIEIVEVEDDLIRNINTPEDYQQALKEIKN